MRKCFFWAGSIFAICILWGVTVWARSVPYMDVWIAAEANSSVTISCTGTIEEKNTAAVFADIPLTARSVYVQSGDTVKKGDLLAVIDRTKTLDLLQSTYSDSLSVLASAGVLQDNFLQSLSSGSELLPRKIFAPVSGTIYRSSLSSDNLSNPDEPLFLISTGGEKQVRLHIPENQISLVQLEQYATVSGIGFEKNYSGTVERIAPEATVSDGIVGVDVWVTVPDADTGFRNGLNASVQIETSVEMTVIKIPDQCVGIDYSCSEYVLLCENGKIQKRTVKVAQSENGYCIISDGISAGDLILMDRTQTVGRRIRPRASEEGKVE